MFSKVIFLVCVFALAAAYVDMDDRLNVEEVVKDVPRFKTHVDCYLDRTPCTPQTAAYKKHFLEMIDDGCRECNDTERHMFKLFLRGLKEKLPLDYEAFKKRYDPNGVHFDATLSQVMKY